MSTAHRRNSLQLGGQCGVMSFLTHFSYLHQMYNVVFVVCLDKVMLHQRITMMLLTIIIASLTKATVKKVQTHIVSAKVVAIKLMSWHYRKVQSLLRNFLFRYIWLICVVAMAHLSIKLAFPLHSQLFCTMTIVLFSEVYVMLILVISCQMTHSTSAMSWLCGK